MSDAFSESWARRQEGRKARRSIGGPLRRYYDSLVECLEADADDFFERVMEIHQAQACPSNGERDH